LAELIDPNFNIDRCTFTPTEFLELINNGGLKTGSCIILDEAGVGIPARQWFDICNKSVGYVLQTFRRENIALIMTTPSLSFIDVQARLLSHCYIESYKVNRRKKRVIVKIKESQLNPQMGKVYRKYYRKGRQRVRKTSIAKPSKELVKAYEHKKKVFSKRLYKDAMADAQKIEVKRLTDKDIADSILKNPEPYIKERAGRKYINRSKIEIDYSIGGARATRVKQMVEKKLGIA